MTSDHEMTGKLALKDEAIAQAAVQWFVRQESGGMSGDDWLAFSEWLGKDSRHAPAFDAVVAADGALDGLTLDEAERQGFASADGKAGPGRRVWIAGIGSLAAALVAAFLFWPVQTEPALETLATAPGENRTLTLDGNITIDLNGATRIAYTNGPSPIVRLDSGEAAFTINSPTPSRLRVEVGGMTLVDRGTSFDVIRDDNGVRIAVGSGKVVINPDDRPVALDAGRSFVRPASGGPATLGNIDPADMASWRSDRLSYRDTPLPMVASDLSRALGVPVKIGAGLSKTRLTGVIPVGGEQSDVVAGAAALAGATAQRSEAGWLISLP